MIRRICFAVLVISVVTISQQLAEDDLKTYRYAGMECDEGCRTIGMYLPGPNGKLTFQTMEKCVNNTYCSCSNGECACENKIGSCVPTYDAIKCGSSGKFPHLTNCSQYYDCEVGKVLNTTSECGNYTYDPCTEKCDIDRPIQECQNTTKVCTKLGELKVIEKNQRLYYVCVKDGDNLIPEMFSCLTGFFDVSTQSCIKSDSGGCVKTDSDEVSSSMSPITISPSTSTQASVSPNTDSPTISTQASVSPSTNSPTTSTQAFTECTHYGYFEDQNDRHRYYFCDAVLHKFHYTCPAKRCFDPNSGKCVKDSC